MKIAEGKFKVCKSIQAANTTKTDLTAFIKTVGYVKISPIIALRLASRFGITVEVFRHLMHVRKGGVNV